MLYSNFSLQEAVDQFGLNYLEKSAVFPASLPLLPDIADKEIAMLNRQLKRDMDLARRTPTEKAKSEFVIAPVLATLRAIQGIGVHSGVTFDVSAEENLKGACDFLITLSDAIEIIRAPVLVVVEAKRSVMSEGLGQCLAEMVAAQKFNRKFEQTEAPIFGCITNGFYWRFLMLSELTVFADSANEYPLLPLDELMRRLCYTVQSA